MEEKSSLMERFTSLQKKRDELKARLVELQTTQNHLRSELEKHTSFLKKEYGVSTLNEAKELEKKMRENAENEISRIEALVSKYEASQGGVS